MSSTDFSIASPLYTCPCAMRRNWAQRRRVHRPDVGLNIDGTEVVERPFLDREGDDKALLGRVIFTGRRYDLHVGIAVLEIEPPQQVAIGFDAVGVINVRGLQEAQKVGFGRLDHVLQPPRRIGLVADEDDRFDAGLFAFDEFRKPSRRGYFAVR